MVPDLIASSLNGADQLCVTLSLAFRNGGPGTEIVTDLELAIGWHDAQELVESAFVGESPFQKLEVKGQGGFETLDVAFIFDSDDYGLRCGWDYSTGAVYELRGRTSKDGRFRFELQVSRPTSTEVPSPATITWKRRGRRHRVALARTLSTS